MLLHILSLDQLKTKMEEALTLSVRAEALAEKNNCPAGCGPALAAERSLARAMEFEAEIARRK